ncbi:Arc family DNA-binding protein, partial [Azotobacter chroococcum]|nr:Arc family DNA-binding protein [Azotobacter chroococcum]
MDIYPNDRRFRFTKACITVLLTAMHHGYRILLHHGDAFGGAMSRKDPQVNMRIPEELLEILDEKAKANCRSRTAEVIFRLK